MTLTTRLLIFFLSMLTILLIGFSVSLYLVAHRYLRQQVKDHLDTVLNTVAGAVETGPEGVEWEPMDRHQNLQFPTFEDQVTWSVADGDGVVIARSSGKRTDDFLAEVSLSHPDEAAHENRKWVAGSWQVGRIVIPAKEIADKHSEPQALDDGVHYSALSITAGVSLRPMQTTLQRLAITLVGLSSGIGFVAFLVGRSVCHRALLPVQRMAIAANQIDADDLTQRLPALQTDDELAELTRSFNHMLDRLEQSFERQRRFTGDASHQLRTPLTAILGQVEVALRRDRTAEEYQQVLQTVQQRTTHLNRMVEALLFLARATEEAQLPTLEPLDVSRWLPTYVETWSEHPRFKDISIECSSQEPLVVLAHPELLGELQGILFDNACKYSSPGTPITIRVSQADSAVSLQVEDHGCGLAPDQFAGLFQPFFRSSEARRQGIDGIGLGLSIAKRLAQIFRGDLTAVSQPHVGSCFTLRLPLKQANCS